MKLASVVSRQQKITDRWIRLLSIDTPPCRHRGSAWSGFRNSILRILYQGAEITSAADVPVPFRASDTGSIRINQSVISMMDYAVDGGSWYSGQLADLYFNNTDSSNVVSYFRALPNLEFQRRFNGTPGCSPLSMDEMNNPTFSISYPLSPGIRLGFAIYSALLRAAQSGGDISDFQYCALYPFYLFGLLRTANASFAPIDGTPEIWLSGKWVTAASVTHAINVTTPTTGASASARASCIKTPKPAITHCIRTTIPSSVPFISFTSPAISVSSDPATSTPTNSPQVPRVPQVPQDTQGSQTPTYCFTAALSSSPVPGSSCTSTTIDKIAFILAPGPAESAVESTELVNNPKSCVELLNSSQEGR
ncbi:hypothetical protein VOLCADRAFT_100255 [Volvox carteri f. nagariensis]|uniref:Pherophorin domain-containing protein n=1 Tax=Volvox carteri f. nagariensis TaxID=3068 RepID=D8UJU3_VOLCA|nr:uncharacterized protein VOLCADRAFT_100255 [Volvox carteri f. nagariensis]EFJ40014.1 hypothetical protein VOLCADRAFT_100255 [Volvox carteri f. nagariensis]|eukprot:XP_002958934.1 hypothetical protein VOLCADRAFT_100255 [Volvox carteri f. nagariensis]